MHPPTAVPEPNSVVAHAILAQVVDEGAVMLMCGRWKCGEVDAHRASVLELIVLPELAPVVAHEAADRIHYRGLRLRRLAGCGAGWQVIVSLSSRPTLCADD